MVREPSNRANIELVTIYEISKILSSSLDLSKTFHEVLNLLAAHLEIRRGLVILKHEDGALHLFSAVGLSRDEYDRGTYQLGEGIIGDASRRRWGLGSLRSLLLGQRLLLGSGGLGLLGGRLLLLGAGDGA